MRPEPDITVFRPDRPGVRKVLGDLEAEVMDVIWARPAGQETTVRDVFEVLARRRRIAYTTVMNTMARLARKKLLRVKRQGPAYVYSPAFTQAEFTSRVTGHILENLLVGFAGPAMNRLKVLDPKIARRVRQLLQEITRRREMEEGR
ncbi:MAG: BlaI/MecI/CopY family transcriptional regulator [Armatimonadetes bacterium]|nr:BlaI/MecI/CopY family transcriptional regulator [Armatimonadota bacterium]